MIFGGVNSPPFLFYFLYICEPKTKATNYKKLALELINKYRISDNDKVTGVVIYAYLKVVEFKEMVAYHSEAERYCYKLSDGKIGTLPKNSIDRITNEVKKMKEVSSPFIRFGGSLSNGICLN